MYSQIIIGNKYNIKTVNNDEFEGIIKLIEPRSNGLGFVVIENNWNITITINLNHIVSFCELEENNVVIPSYEDIEPERNEIKIIRIGESEDAFKYFDDPVIPLTKEQEFLLEETAKKAFKEMTEFIKE